MGNSITPYIEHNKPNDPQHFVVDSPEKANWAIKRVKEARTRRDLFIQACQCEIETLQRQMDQAKQECDDTTAWYLLQLDTYLDTVPAKKTKTQLSLALPAGKLVRKQSSKSYQRDEDKLVQALDGTEFVAYEAKLKWKELKEHIHVVEDVAILKETGEVLDGITVTDVPPVLDIK